MPFTKEWVARTTRRALSAVLVAALPVACGGSGSSTDGSALLADPAAQLAPSVDAQASWPGAYLAGRHAMLQRDFTAAAGYFSRTLGNDPENVDLLRRTYALLAAEGDIDGAVAVVHRLQGLKEENTIANVVLAVKAAQMRNFAEVERLLVRQPRHGLNSFLVPLMVAWAQYGEGKVDAALETMAGLKKAEHLKTLYSFHAGLMNDLAERPAAAAELYKATVETENGLSLRAVEVVGSFYLRHGEPDKAKALYDRYRAAHPETALLDGIIPGLDGRTAPRRPVTDAAHGIAETLFGAATTVREGNAIDSSLLFARLTLAVQPDFPLAQVLVGDILQSQGRFAQANTIYDTITRDAPVFYSAKLRIADNLRRMEDTPAAIAVLEGLAEARPDRADALVDLGDILRAEKKFPAAAVAYEQALKRIKQIEPRHWTLFYSRGIAYERSRDWKKAESDFLKALELEPEQPYVLNYLGYSWLEQRINIDNAKAMIQKAVDQRPEDGYIVDSLGWSFYLTGDYPSAVREIERAVELQPDDPVINDHLGDAYWRVGRRNEARFQWRRALSLNPEADTIAPITDKLEQGLGDLPTTVGTNAGAGTGATAGTASR